MEPYEFRFQKYKSFSFDKLPLTKNNEQYFMLKQIDKKYRDIHYYIVCSCMEIIGRFDSNYNDSTFGITYHIDEKFQNRGIGQIALRYIVDDIFDKYKPSKLRIITTQNNDKSKSIALKCGFSNKRWRIYELKFSEYQKQKSQDILNENDLEER